MFQFLSFFSVSIVEELAKLENKIERRILRPLIPCGLLLCALHFAACAQVEYDVHRIDVNSGLAGNTVYDFLQDSSGFMWVASNNGIQRFDMHTFRNYAQSTESVSSVLYDYRGRLWVCGSSINILDLKGGSRQSIPIFVNGVEKHFTLLPRIHQDSKHRIWLKTTLIEFPRQTFLLLFSEKTMRFEPPAELKIPNLSANHILDVVELPGNNLLAYTRQGLYYLNESNGTVSSRFANYDSIPFLRMRELSGRLHNLWVDNENLLVFVWENLALYWINKEFKLKHTFYGKGDVKDVLFDEENTAWIAGENLRRLNPEKGIDEYVQLPDDIKMINTIFQDREGNIWLGTHRGIVIIDPKSRVIKKPNQALGMKPFSGETIAVTRTTGGIVMVSTWPGGIFYYDDDLRPLHQPKLLGTAAKKMDSIPLWVFREDSQKDIWIGGQDGNLFLLHKKTNMVTHMEDTTFDKRTIRSIEEDKHGNIWIGTQGGRIIKWTRNQKKFKTIYTPSSDTHPVTFLRQDGDQIWASAGINLLKIDVSVGRLIDKLTLNEKQRPVVFGPLAYTSDHDIIIGTSIGLVALNKQTNEFKIKVETFAEIFSIETRGPEHFVMALANGATVEYRSGNMIGLDKGNFYSSPHTGVRLPNGNVVFAEGGGLVVVKPPVRSANRITPLVITSINVLGKELDVDSVLSSGITLPHDKSFISVGYSALTFREKDNVAYHSRTHDNQEFANLGNNRSITYGQLPTGNHRVEIYYSMPDGAKSQHVSFSVLVKPPFWREAWFITGVILIVAVAIYSVYLMRQKRTKALAQIHARISRDLHDEMGSNLSSLNILTNVVRDEFSKITLESKMKEMLQKISELSAKAMDAMDDIVWALNPRHDSFAHTVARMRSFGAQRLEDRGIDLIFNVEGDPKTFNLDIEGRNNLYQIYKEAIDNISKYAFCKNVYVNLSVRKGKLKLVISDDGTGLVNIKVRPKNINEQVIINSELTMGTRLKLEISPRARQGF